MVRSLTATYNSALEKIALDRDLARYLQTSKSLHSQDVGWRIARCADDINIWFVNEPERGWLHGRFWKCNHKLCSFCLSSESRRRRRTLFDAIDALSLGPRKWHFVTFTLENPAASIVTTRRIVNDAWAKFRKKGAFVEVRAGAKSEEFTITKTGYHYHIHSLIDSPYIEYQLWRRHWTEAVESAGGTSQNLFGFQTIDGYLILNVKRVKNPRDIVNELGKYITKSTSFKGLSKETLSELAEVKRWNRMFELLGDLRNQKRIPRAPKEQRSIVHTKSLSGRQDKDLWWFEKKRGDTRNFMNDALSYRFQSEVYTIHEIRTKITKSHSR